MKWIQSRTFGCGSRTSVAFYALTRVRDVMEEPASHRETDRGIGPSGESIVT
jgi:hypothetical protein